MRGLEEAAVFPREIKERGLGWHWPAGPPVSATPALRFATWETGLLLERGCRPRAGPAASPAGRRARSGAGWHSGAGPGGFPQTACSQTASQLRPPLREPQTQFRTLGLMRTCDLENVSNLI